MMMIDELERLSVLREKGAITEAQYEQAKARILADPSVHGTRPSAASADLRPAARPGFERLRRSTTDRWLGGVCGGVARATDTEAWIWRLGFTAGLVFGGVTAVIYLLLWIFVPVQAPGEPVA